MRHLAYLSALAIASIGLVPSTVAKDAVQRRHSDPVGGMHGLGVELDLKNLPPGMHSQSKASGVGRRPACTPCTIPCTES